MLTFDAPFMPWIDQLPEVGDRIRNERARLLELAGEAADLERHALALRHKVAAGEAELLCRVLNHWTPEDIARAKARAVRFDSNARAVGDAGATKLGVALSQLDGNHLAVEAVQAFAAGDVLGTIDPATATADECRDALQRLALWWTVAGQPVCRRLRDTRGGN